MKKFFTILTLAAVALVNSFSASAEEPNTVLSVYMKDGKFEVFKFADKPSVTFADQKILVSSENASGEYAFDAVSHFAFEDGNLVQGIEEIAGEKTAAFSFEYTDNANVVVASPELKWVKVYTAQGVEVAAAAANDGVATVSVASLAPGVYIVAPSCHSALKIVKR